MNINVYCKINNTKQLEKIERACIRNHIRPSFPSAIHPKSNIFSAKNVKSISLITSGPYDDMISWMDDDGEWYKKEGRKQVTYNELLNIIEKIKNKNPRFLFSIKRT